MKKRVVFITGAANGIGLEIGRMFLQAGAKVVFTDQQRIMVEKVAENFKTSNYDCLGIPCDVTNEEEIRWAINRTMKHYGKIDVLINNAGLQHIDALEDFPKEKFELMLKIMLTAPFLTIKYVFPYMKRQKFGRIINIASINGIIGFAGKAAYNSAKHGVIGLTKVAALEGATHGITVNSLCPGYVDTALVRNQLADLAQSRNISLEKVLEEVIYPLVPQRKLLDAKEIAHYALFLASEQAKSVTGQAIVIDGGYTVQ